MKHLQRTSKTYETIETYKSNIRFQRNFSLLLGRMEARRCMVFNEGSGPAALVNGEPAAVAARCRRDASGARLGEGSSVSCRAKPVAERHDLEAAARRAWQGQRPSGALQRWSRAAPRRTSGRALRGGRRANKNDRKTNEWIRGISG
jgi:hypothetical protein